MAGYSAKPLAKKLGIKPAAHVYLEGAPANYLELLDPLPEHVAFATLPGLDTDLVHLFTKSRFELEQALPRYLEVLRPDAVIWVSWPKRSAKVETDLTEDVIREVALPLGLVDVKVCAVDDVWSGLKLVVRLKNR